MSIFCEYDARQRFTTFRGKIWCPDPTERSKKYFDVIFFPSESWDRDLKNFIFLLPVEYSGAVEYSTDLGHPPKIAIFLTKKVPNSLESPENELRGRARVQNASPGSVEHEKIGPRSFPAGYKLFRPEMRI